MKDDLDATHPGRSRGGRLPSRRSALAALLLVLPAQSVGVAAMLLALPGPAGLLINGLSRLWMLVLPIVWTFRVERRRPRWTARPTRPGMVAGVVTGAIIFLAMIGAYLVVADRIDLDRLRDRATTTGFDRPALFAGMLGFIILANSLLEEFVWRWFVPRQAEALMPSGLGAKGRRAAAVVVAATAFTIHHVIALAAWVDAPLVALGSLGVFLGAVVWSILFAYDGTLWPGYVSHVFADVAILVIAYDVLFRAGP